jgi:uncharacterized integral membrane protein
MTYPPGSQPQPQQPPPGAEPESGVDATASPANTVPVAEPADSAPAAAPARPRGVDERGRPRGGKVSALWIGLIVAAVLLILLLIFIAQNSKTVPIHFLGASGHISLAVALLLSAVVAVLLVAIPGSVRIMQLRRLVKRTARQRDHDSR